MTDAVVCDNLTFSYGASPVLRGVDLRIGRGEVVCLLGPNGAGKTTMVETMLGSLPPASGSVRVMGHNPRSVPPAFWSRVGLVQQNWSDHPKWRVIDQLEWIRAAHRTVTGEVLEAGEVLAAVGLQDKATARLGALSGGQRRAVDFAAALMSRPELLILDEPTTGLDPAAKARLHDLILDCVDQVGATVLMTTHDLAEAERIASRILILLGGRILADGTVTELRESLVRAAEVTWIQDGRRHVHATDRPEEFLTGLDMTTISNLTVSRPTLEDAYLALVAQQARDPQRAGRAQGGTNGDAQRTRTKEAQP